MVRLNDFPTELAAEISYHMELLLDAGLVDGKMVKAYGADINEFLAHKLTWEGLSLIHI